jgi:hypothetical protein
MFCAALGIGASLSPGIGSARAYIDIDIAQPKPAYEIVPAPRRGYVWAPGYWGWRHHKHYWVGGHWVRARHGHHWVGARWADHHGRWRFEAGHWD